MIFSESVVLPGEDSSCHNHCCKSPVYCCYHYFWVSFIFATLHGITPRRYYSD